MSVLTDLLLRFAEIKGEATSSSDAVSKGLSTFIVLDKNFNYGGYRLERVELPGHSIANECYGMNSVGARLKTKEMIAYMTGLINADNP